MTPEEFHRQLLPEVCKKDFDRLKELGQIKEPDYKFAEMYHKAKVERVTDEAKKYLLDIGFDDAHLPELVNDDDKSIYTIPELMQAYTDHKLKLLGIADVVVPKGTFACHEELEGRQKCDRQCSRIDCHYLNQEAS